MMSKRLISVVFAIIAVFFLSAVCFAEGEFVPGVRTDTQYISETLGIRIDLTEDYVMATDDEIRQMMQIGAGVLLDEDNAKNLLNITDISLYYDMMAVNPLDGSTVLVMAEKPILSGMTQKQYMDANIAQLKNTLGISDIEQDQIEICGIQYDGLAYPITAAGYEIEYVTFISKVGDRFVSITLSGLTEDSLMNAASMISCIEK